MSAPRIAIRAVGVLLAAVAVMAPAALAARSHARSGRFQIRHVFVIVLENESASTTFGPNSPAPYLARTLTARGAYLPNYYGVGHYSNDNYIAMISGQAPNPQNQTDCPVFDDFPAGALVAHGQEPGTGCVYPADVQTIASQLDAAHLSWRAYEESMGNDPAREAARCGHPAIGSPDNTERATATDMYATRHDPFVYFHSIIDHAALCDSHVVGLNSLSHDLAHVSTTRNYTFITPNLCDDGHDPTCADGETGGLVRVNSWLRSWVPKITSSRAFKRDGLLIVTFDEAETSDASSCCGELAGPGATLPGLTGPGGGDVGAVLLSPCIAPGTVSRTPYNHYAMLGSIEDIFGLHHLGYAGLRGERYFGADIFKRQCGPAAPRITGGSASAGPAHGSRVRIGVSWRATTRGGTALAHWQVQLRRGHRWATVVRRGRRGHYSFTGRAGAVYRLRARAVNLAGQRSRWATATVVGSAT